MNRFVMVVSKLVKDKFHMAMLGDDMDISLLMVFDKQIEESFIHKEK